MIRKRIKQISMAVVGVLLAVGVIVNVHAAEGIDTTTECSITFSLKNDGFPELAEETVQMKVSLYKVADVTTSGEFVALDGFKDLTLSAVANGDGSAKEWSDRADKALKIVEALKKAGTEPVSIQTTISTTGTKVDKLAAGLYLIVGETAQSANYEYNFTPYLMALPTNSYYTDGDDAWDYDPANVITTPKLERTDRYGNLVIDKVLDHYNSTLGKVSFIFRVVAQKGDKDVYNDVVAIDFDEPGFKELELEHIPAGASVTVTELNLNGSYSTKGNSVQTIKIVADKTINDTKDVARVTFENDYNGKVTGGTGTVNHFEKAENGKWIWTKQ